MKSVIFDGSEKRTKGKASAEDGEEEGPLSDLMDLTLKQEDH